MVALVSYRTNAWYSMSLEVVYHQFPHNSSHTGYLFESDLLLDFGSERSEERKGKQKSQPSSKQFVLTRY